jgi:hypothetical protein
MKSTIEQNTPGNQTVVPVERQTYTIAEAAKILGISRTVAYRPGVLPTINVGRRRVLPKPVLERMLAGNIVIPNGEGPTKPPEKFSANEPDRTLPANRRGAHRASVSSEPRSRTRRRMRDDIGRASQ